MFAIETVLSWLYIQEFKIILITEFLLNTIANNRNIDNNPLFAAENTVLP